MPCTDAQVEHYKTRGYVAGLRVLSDEQIGQLKEGIEDILQLPPAPVGETVERSRAKGQPPSVKVVNILRREPLFRPSSTMRPSAPGAPAHARPGAHVGGPDGLQAPYDEETALAWHRLHLLGPRGPADLGTCWIALDNATVDNCCMHPAATCGHAIRPRGQP